MKPAARIGDLRHRLVLEAPVRAGDGGGGAVVIWTFVAEIWGSVRPVTGSERLVAEQLSGRISHEIFVRHRDDIVPAMRFRHGSRVLQILAVLDVGERGRMLECLCREELL